MTFSGFELRAVSKSYGSQTVLKEISCALPSGRHSAILGRSGCGKSTLLRLLAGLEPPDAGEILLDGADASTPEAIKIAPHIRDIGMVFQDLALWPNLSILDNVSLGASKRSRGSGAKDALALCGIAPLAGRRPGELSGGQQQRAALARAIAANPSFLFLDEPFSGLDWATKADLMTEISTLIRNRDLTALLVSHDPAEVLALAEYLIVLEDGRIAEMGTIAALLERPQTTTTELLRNFSKGVRLQGAP